ncbi:N-succinylarginine dihydrolase [Streptomyces sp. CB00316]|uniref:N-succinylarginine dihydrolase n=1 Tax=Streptomyces sp. CB00316 TaxID=1703932 RepID=UPI000A595E69|nr:N-succinylarginine dihydrolase [Streptomyces sp. CB00316]
MRQDPPWSASHLPDRLSPKADPALIAAGHAALDDRSAFVASLGTTRLGADA